MNEAEALQICRLAKAASPAQSVDEYTPDLWALVLEPHRFIDARQALVELAASQEWIHVSHIVKQIKLVRRNRVLAFGALPDPPSDIEADPERYSHWLRATTRAIADGTMTERPALPAGKQRPVDFTRVFKSVGDEVVLETRDRRYEEPTPTPRGLEMGGGE